ncbi:MAG TPA: hypothetical protein VN892_03555, partial [Solirubrobacteraceae bacterium]|nr:hypothetical protein [Solirubrobacteraceae bacterium]
MSSGPHTPHGRRTPVTSERPARRSVRSPAGRAARRRGPAAQRREDGSELGARILAAVPAIAVALFLVIEGGLIFALGMLVLGCVCMHELYSMYARARPVRLAGFLALAGLLAAALYGAQYQVLLAAVAAL